MTTLHLGTVDLPYVLNETPAQMRKRIKKRPHPEAGQKTTGDIAEILEAKYHVMEHFWEIHGAEIVEAGAEGLVQALENQVMGAPIEQNPYGEMESAIKRKFDDFITNKEMDRLGVPGVPTKASLEGRSSRFKKGKGKKGRPSFVNTGLYLSSFAAWVD